MTEKPRWKPEIIQGGLAESPQKITRKSESETITVEKLLEVWARVTSDVPSDWNSSIRPQLLESARKNVMEYTVAQLYKALSASTLWTRPSFARAVTDEVAERIRLRDFRPRK